MKDSIVFPEKLSTTKRKKNIFKISVHYYTDRDCLIKSLMIKETDMEFKLVDKWTFKVKTYLSYTELLAILVQRKVEGFIIRKSWIF